MEKTRLLKRNPEPVKTISRPQLTVTQPKSEPAKPQPTHWLPRECHGIRCARSVPCLRREAQACHMLALRK